MSMSLDRSVIGCIDCPDLALSQSISIVSYGLGWPGHCGVVGGLTEEVSDDL